MIIETRQEYKSGNKDQKLFPENSFEFCTFPSNDQSRMWEIKKCQFWFDRKSIVSCINVLFF